MWITFLVVVRSSKQLFFILVQNSFSPPIRKGNCFFSEMTDSITFIMLVDVTYFSSIHPFK